MKRLDVIFKTSLLLTLALVALLWLQNILMPIVFAIIFSLLYLPLVKRLEKKVSTIISISLLLVVSLVLVVTIGWLATLQLKSLVASLPDVEEKFFTWLTTLSQQVDVRFQIHVEEQIQFIKEAAKSAGSLLSTIIFQTSFLLYFIVQVPLYMFLFLFYRKKIAYFFEFYFPSIHAKKVQEIQLLTRQYIIGLTLVVLITGSLNSIGLYALGIEHALFFGFFSGALTLIPYVGITLGAMLPTLFALVTKDSIGYAIGVVALHTFVQFLEGNFITPRITGSRISLNAFAAILALVIGGKIWGIPGMILAVPLLGVVKILLREIPQAKGLLVLLGNEDVEEKNSPDTPSEESAS